MESEQQKKRDKELSALRAEIHEATSTEYGLRLPYQLSPKTVWICISAQIKLSLHMIAHDRRIAENTASDRQRLYKNTFQRLGGRQRLYGNTFQRLGDRERS